jgi:NAD(P)-dependent dehydrogenase (short-subunit alcohol dehydrogenase family)
MSTVADGDLPEVVLPDVPSYPLLRRQKALVTGAGSGIGKAIALAMASAGAAVAVNYRAKEEAARTIVAQIEADGGRAIAVQGRRLQGG